MFIAIVQIPMTKRPRDAAVEAAAKSAPTYTALGAKGLLKKYYLNGEAGGGEGRGHELLRSEVDRRLPSMFIAIVQIPIGRYQTGTFHVDGRNP